MLFLKLQKMIKLVIECRSKNVLINTYYFFATQS